MRSTREKLAVGFSTGAAMLPFPVGLCGIVLLPAVPPVIIIVGRSTGLISSGVIASSIVGGHRGDIFEAVTCSHWLAECDCNWPTSIANALDDWPIFQVMAAAKFFEGDPFIAVRHIDTISAIAI